jgi:hypothetical protein
MNFRGASNVLRHAIGQANRLDRFAVEIANKPVGDNDKILKGLFSMEEGEVRANTLLKPLSCEFQSVLSQGQVPQCAWIMEGDFVERRYNLLFRVVKATDALAGRRWRLLRL